MANKMEKAGFAKNKLKVLCNFIEAEKVELIKSVNKVIKEEAFCYIGRLSEEKGINNLLEVASQLPYKLYIAGDGPLKDVLNRKYASNKIIFLGHQNKIEIINLFKKVHFSVIPSIWYENNPLSVIESLCSGTPVLGSNMGGIPELLTDEFSEIYNAYDCNELKSKIKSMFSKKIDSEALSSTSIKRFSANRYYDDIMKIYCYG